MSDLAVRDTLHSVVVNGRRLQIETRGIGIDRADAGPVIVFLHEGLGSVSLWRDFPQQLCEALGLPGLVYSRPGYGRSTAREAAERWGLEFMHVQALHTLPALIDAAGLQSPYLLFGHSDGASIALIHAARFAQRVAACIVLAPHVFVEPISLESIRRARTLYESAESNLRRGLSSHHDDVDSAFYGWNDAWLDPRFPSWNIEALLADVTCPVLAIQGEDDEYGTLEQIHSIAARAPLAREIVLADCGHSPHRDRPQQVIAETRNFLAGIVPAIHDASKEKNP